MANETADREIYARQCLACAEQAKDASEKAHWEALAGYWLRLGDTNQAKEEPSQDPPKGAG